MKTNDFNKTGPHLPKNFPTERFVNDWKNGMSLKSIAKKYGLKNVYAVNKAILKLKLDPDLRKKSFYDKFIQSGDTVTFAEMYADRSVRIENIRTHFKLPDKSYVSKIARKLGLPIRDSYRSMHRFGDKKSKFNQMWKEEIPLSTISKELGVSQITLNKWKKQLNLPNRHRALHIKKQLLKDAKKLFHFLIESHGIVSVADALVEIEVSSHQLKQITDLAVFDSIKFELNAPVTSRWNDSSCFGYDAHQKFVFLKAVPEVPVLKLSEIIAKNNYKKTESDIEEKNFYILNLLSIEYKQLKDYENMLSDLTKYPDHRHQLKDEIDLKLLSLEFNLRINDLMPAKSMKKDILKEILEQKNSQKFFGQTFSHKQFLIELESAERQEHQLLLKSLFLSMNFQIAESTESFYDFKIVGNISYLVKLMIYQKISKTDVLALSACSNQRGIVITLEDYDADSNENFEKIGILGRSEIEFLLNSVDYIPASKNSLGKIMYGRHRGKVGYVIDLDFETSTATVELLLENKNVCCPISSIKQLILFYDKNELGKFSKFFNKVFKITSPEIIFTMDFENVVLRNSQNEIHNKIDGLVDKHSVSLYVRKDFEMVGNTSHPSGIGFCRTFLLKCDCLYWKDQGRPVNLCKHLITFLFFLWNKNPRNIKQIGNVFNIQTDSVIRKYLNRMLDEIYLLVRLSATIENFWIKCVEEPSNFQVDERLIAHLVICYILENYPVKKHSNFLKLTIEERCDKKFYKLNKNTINRHFEQKLTQIQNDDELLMAINNTSYSQMRRILKTLNQFWDDI